MTRLARPHHSTQNTDTSTAADFAGAKPIEAPAIPQNAYMAPNGRSNVHNDSYMSDTYEVKGPSGDNPIVRESKLGGICITITFDSRGRINTLATEPSGKHLLYLVDPITMLEIGEKFELPWEPGNLEWGGAGYFYMDNQDRLIVPTITLQIWVIEVVEGGEGASPKFKSVKEYDLADAIATALDMRPHESLSELDNLLSALPDFNGNLWFVTKKGVVGYIEKDTEKVFTHLLKNPDAKGEEDELEGVANSFATDETGGVFILSNYALYRFESGSDGVRQIWREGYDHGRRPAPKPGQSSIGSGTTPTLTNIGDKQYVAIADNADPRMHVVVFRREKDYIGKREVCKHPVFSNFKGCTDNSLICVNNSIIVENNYGYRGPMATAGALTTEPGMARIDFDEDGNGSREVWLNRDIVVPSVVSKLSLTDGLIYTYAKKGSEWYLAAIDFENGNVVFTVPVGGDIRVNDHYAGLYLRPDGRAYVGVFEGIVSVSDA